MSAQKVIEELFRHKVEAAELEAHIGSFRNGYLVHAREELLRINAASGGMATALLLHLLNEKLIDGALVTTVRIEDNKVRPVFRIATTVEEILQAQGSKYSAVAFASEALPLLQEFTGRLAVVLLPCDAKLLQHQRKKDPALDRKIECVISLFCGHNSDSLLTDRIVARLNTDAEQLVGFRYRRGHWRGQMELVFPDRVMTAPFATFSDYQNLYFFCQRKCLYCEDHFGYHSDLSAGDIWSGKMKSETIKHTAVISRTEIGERFLHEAGAAGRLEITPMAVEEIFQGQIRTARCHYQVSARHRVGKLFRENIPDTIKAKVRPVDLLIACIVLFNYRLSQSRLGQRLVFMIPRPLLKVYLYIFKALESI